MMGFGPIFQTNLQVLLSDFCKNDVAGGFPQADYTLLRSNPALARTIATFLLNKTSLLLYMKILFSYGP